MADFLIFLIVGPMVVLWVIAAICVAMVASSRNRDWFGWFLYALLIWPIALTHVLILPPVKIQAKPSNNSDDDMSHIL